MTDRKAVNPARIQFSWGCAPDAPARWFLWVFCFFRRAKSPVTGKYYVPVKRSNVYPLAVLISVRGLLLWSLASALITYFGGAAVLANWYERKPFNRITYSDLVLPWRWSQFDTLRGKANLDQAEADLKNGNIRSAFAFLRSGLARYPDDPTARLQLASIYILFRLRVEAEKTLINAFNHAYPGSDYLKKAVSLIEPGDNPTLLIEFCNRGRAALAADDRSEGRDARYLDGVKVKTLLQLDRTDEAVALIEKYQPKDIAFLQMAKVAQGIVRGDLAAAEAELKVWLAAMPDAEPALTTAVRVYRVAGKVPELQAAILRLRSLYPENPAHIGLALSESLRLGQIQAALDLLDISVIRFANQPAAYGEWAEAIGKTGHDEVLARLEQLVTESNQNPQTVIYARLMAQIRAQAWADAEASSARLDALYPNVHPRMQALHRVGKALLAACSQPVKGAENTLANTITGGWVAMSLYEQIVDALALAERYEAALEVLTLAEGFYPTSRYIAMQRAALTPKLAEQNAIAARALAQQTPVAAVDPAVPADAEALFAALDAQAQAGRSAEALNLARAARKAAPAWLQAALPELEWREVLLAADTDDLPLLQLNLRTELRAATEAQIDRLVAQAQTWFAGQRQPVALLTLREVVRVRPEHPLARRLLAEWSPDEAAGGLAPAVAAPNAALVPAGAPGTAPAAAVVVPGSEAALFEALDALATPSGAAEALRLVRAVRKAEPAWLGAARPELEWREVLLAVQADDLSLLQLNLRTYLRGRPAGLARVLEQASAWHAEGRNSVALLAVREVLRQQPEQAAAQKLLREWSAP